MSNFFSKNWVFQNISYKNEQRTFQKQVMSSKFQKLFLHKNIDHMKPMCFQTFQKRNRKIKNSKLTCILLFQRRISWKVAKTVSMFWIHFINRLPAVFPSILNRIIDWQIMFFCIKITITITLIYNSYSYNKINQFRYNKSLLKVW